MDGRDSLERSEVLVILGSERATQALEEIRTLYRVAQMASARVLVVEASGPDAEGQMRAIPGVRAITASDLPAESFEGLDQAESLFARAWMQRARRSASRPRRGEGQAWDARGLDPPDLPTLDSGKRDE
jgi:hypothetical protein